MKEKREKKSSELRLKNEFDRRARHFFFLLFSSVFGDEKKRNKETKKYWWLKEENSMRFSLSHYLSLGNNTLNIFFCLFLILHFHTLIRVARKRLMLVNEKKNRQNNFQILHSQQVLYKFTFYFGEIDRNTKMLYH